MKAHRVVVIGNGRMAQRCSEILRRSADVRLVVAEPRNDAAQARLATFCSGARIRLITPDESINSAGVLTAVAAERPDYIFSIDNFQIFADELLRIPQQGCINFHNGPIDRYRGMHSPSWAIFNGETEHGVTWHYMRRDVDDGAIAAEEKMSLTGNETGLSLTLECIRVGIDSLERELDAVLAGRQIRTPRSATAKIYRRTDLPDGGVLDLRSTAAHISRLLRATDFRPIPNPFTYARLPSPGGQLIVNEVEALGTATGYVAGEIVAADARLVVACADRLLSVVGVMLEPDETASVEEVVTRLGLRPGQRLVPRENA